MRQCFPNAACLQAAIPATSELCQGIRKIVPHMPIAIPDPRLERPPLCASAPLSWSLVPLMLGIAAGGIDLLVPSLILLAVAGAVLWHRCRIRCCVVVASLAAGFLVQWHSGEQPHAAWERLPKREATILMRIEELFNTRTHDRVSGIGKILQTDIPYDTVTGSRISFYLETGNPGPLGHGLGRVVCCGGVITYLPSIDKPDRFQEYLLGRDVFITINQGAVIGTMRESPLAEQIRMRHFRFLRDILKGRRHEAESPGNVLASMLLGDRSLLSDARIDLYRQTGTYHLFAVSGLHVGCVAVFLAGIIRITGLPGRLLPLPVLVASWYYVWLTGSSPSAVRAGIMISCLMLGRMLLRQPHLFPALIVSAWIVLILFPHQLFSLGFQLSYAVVASIILFGLPASSFLANLLRRKSNETCLGRRQRLVLKYFMKSIDLACISTSAGIVSIPLIVEHFQLFTPAGLFIGIVLNPMATLAIMLGCIATCVSPVSSGLAWLLTQPAYPLIRAMEWMLQSCLQVPGAWSGREWTLPHSGTVLVIVLLTVAWLQQYLRQRSGQQPGISVFLPVLLVAACLIFGSIGT